jgi:hypothetical protein
MASVHSILIVPLVVVSVAAAGCAGSDGDAGQGGQTTRLEPGRLRELELTVVGEVGRACRRATARRPTDGRQASSSSGQVGQVPSLEAAAIGSFAGLRRQSSRAL